ncbi:hypothetical protein CYMTET_30399, partial [Cymbomonas tetramitiformis]
LYGEQRVLQIALSSTCVQMVVLAFADNTLMVFGGLLLGSLGYMTFPSISSMKANNAGEHEQGAVQGALYGARAFAQGIGPLIFSYVFTHSTRTDSGMYWPGASFMFGGSLMALALSVAATIDTIDGQAVILCSPKSSPLNSPKKVVPKSSP